MIIEISDETYAKIRDQLTEEESANIDSLHDMIGKAWFFRTATYFMWGRVVGIFGNHVRLENASWIANTPRFMQFIKTGELDEVELIDDWFVNLSACTDFGIWRHQSPKTQLHTHEIQTVK